MNWYLARLRYQQVSHDGNLTAYFDDQWRLIRADEKEWAVEKATLLAKLGQYESEEAASAKLNYKFISLVDICEIGPWVDGVLLQSTIITA